MQVAFRCAGFSSPLRRGGWRRDLRFRRVRQVKIAPAVFAKLDIVAAFDAEPGRKRDKEIKQPIYGMDELSSFVKKQNIKMAILTVPAAVAQETANALVRAGVTGILNFAPIVLSVPEELMVNNVNLAIELENLSYFTQE